MRFGFAVVAAVGVVDDSFDDTRTLAQLARAEGFDALAHGCTAAGNDQVRFEAALAVVAPKLEMLAPVRDLGLSREQEVAYLKEVGFPIPASGGRYSINAGLWGLTIGGGEMLGSGEPLPDDAWVWTRGGGGEAHMTLTFEDGEHTGATPGRVVRGPGWKQRAGVSL